MMQRKHIGALLAALAMALVLPLQIFALGCNGRGYEDDPQETVSTQEPEIIPAEERSFRSESILLYYPSLEDTEKLLTETRIVTFVSTMSIVDVAVRELLKGPESDALYAIIPQDVGLLSVEQSSTLVTLHFSDQLMELEDRERLLAKISIINTVASLSGVQYVNVMCDDKEVTINGYSAGASELYSGTLESRWNEINQILETGMDSPKRAVLYFQDKTQTFLVPEVRVISSGDDSGKALIEELLNGPVDTGRCSRVLGQTCMLQEDPRIVKDSDGNSILTIRLTSDPEFWGMSAGRRILRIGAVVLSVTGFLPEVDYVSIEIGNTKLETILLETDSDVPGFQRADFGILVGNTITLYYPSKEMNRLMKTERTVEQSSVDRPRAVLQELLKGPTNEEMNGMKNLPDGLEISDILGIRVQEEQMTLNLSQRAVTLLKELEKSEQVTSLYAIINTMCEIQGIKRVRFLCEGQTISDGFYLSLQGALLPNRGMVY